MKPTDALTLLTGGLTIMEDSIDTLRDSIGLATTTDVVAQSDACMVMPLTADTTAAEPPMNLLDILKQNFFTLKDTLTADTLLPMRNFGVAGDPIPYTIRGDNMITILLIVCFVLFIVAVAHSQRFIGKQLKDFFYIPHNDDITNETSSELRFLIFLVLVDSLVLSISTYLFATGTIATKYVFQTDIWLVAILFGMFTAYFALKSLLYALVNLTFFGSKKNIQFMHSFLLVTACEGVMFFPMVMLQVYFDLSTENAIYYFCFVLILNKMLTFYKAWVIFFQQTGGFLQTFLYFCALEIVPLLAFAGAWWTTIDSLKINF